jgi:transcriptional regulator with XRE-family HTH domain
MPTGNTLRTELGARIRKIRADKGLTGQELAKLSKISATYLSEVERGLSDVSGEKLIRIADALCVDIQDLISPGQTSAQNGENISIPIALSEAADELRLSFRNTVRILQGAQSLTARRSSTPQEEWAKQDWITFYEKVKFILEE